MASYLPDETDIPSTSRGTSLEMHLTNQYCLDKDSDEPIALGIGILVLKVLLFCSLTSSILICYPLSYHNLCFLFRMDVTPKRVVFAML